MRIVLAAALALAAGSALAQVSPPNTAAQTTQGLRNSMEVQGQQRSIQQQQQFENNQIRSEVQRSQTVPQVDSRGRIR